MCIPFAYTDANKCYKKPSSHPTGWDHGRPHNYSSMQQEKSRVGGDEKLNINFMWPYIIKYKNIFTKMLNDVGMEVPKSIETRSKFSMHADKSRG